MKTAMQELIEWIDNDFRKQSTIPTIQQLKNKAKQLLEKEKEQIILSYIHNRYVLADGHPIRRDESEEYYNQTYNQNK